MTLYVPCELSVDTVTLNWYNIHTVDVGGWKYNVAEDAERMDAFSKYMADGVIVAYIPGRSQISVSFSASRIANGYNCFEYTNNEYDIVKEKIEMAVCQATGMHLPFEEGVISRLDVYRSFVFPDVKDCKVFVKWLQDQPIIGKYKREAYSDNGEWRWFESGLVLKAYIKNEDPHIPQKIRDTLPPMVRLEVESRKGFRRKLLGKKVTADILKYPAIWVDYYNTALDKFKLNGILMNKRNLHKKTEQTMRTEKPNVRQATITKAINAVECFLRGDKGMRAEAVRIMNKVYTQGVCPFPLTNPAVIANRTLSASAVLSATEQVRQEYNIDSVKKTMAFFNKCINNKKEKSKCEKIIFAGYIFPLSTGQYHLVPIQDSS